MLTVACVMTGNYCGRGAEYVRRLQRAVDYHLPALHRFVCITDEPIDGVECLLHDSGFPGWWQKASLFAPGRFTEGRVVYFDLDTAILGNLGPLARERGDFAILRDVWKPQIGQSAVMAWRAGWGEPIFEAAAAILQAQGLDPTRRMDPLIASLTPDRLYLQDLFPGMFRSYKAECQAGPGDAAVVFFHGKPRPHELPEDHWARRTWEGAA